MTYLATTINESPVIVEKAASKLSDVRGKAIKLTADGAALCGAGEAAIGIGIMTNDEVSAAGADVHIQVKDIGLVCAGAAITKGAELAANAEGKLIPAVSGQYVAAIALAAAGENKYAMAKLTGYQKA